MGDSHSPRWKERPVLAWFLRLILLLIPVSAAVAAGLVLAYLLPLPRNRFETVVGWLILTAGSTLTLYLGDNLARRFLPLVALLRLSLIFPDRAPSRFSVALRAGSTQRLLDRPTLWEEKRKDIPPSEAAETILALITRLGQHDRQTRGHSERVRRVIDMLAEELRLPPPDRDRLQWAALLHDLGKLKIPPEVLNKPGALSEEEWALIRSHPSKGAEIAAPLKAWLGEWFFAIEQHHERFDGSGYPRGLSGESISRGGRIVAVADAFDVMVSNRSYRTALSPETARAELVRSGGTHFDPEIVRALLSISLGRFTWMMAPLAWVLQIPFLSNLEPDFPAAIPSTIDQNPSGGAGAFESGLHPSSVLHPVVQVHPSAHPHPDLASHHPTRSHDNGSDEQGEDTNNASSDASTQSQPDASLQQEHEERDDHSKAKNHE